MRRRGPGRSSLAGTTLNMTTIEQVAETKTPARETPQPVKESLPMAAAIRREITDDQICILTFDRPDSAANIFDRATLEELAQHLDVIAKTSSLRGLILASAKRSIFIAGADLHSMSQFTDPADLDHLIRLGQQTFDQLETLSIPTIAAIHGACVGGGYEICLACDYRIATSDRATKIGLTETQLGILPAWGGSTRLPRLIGLPKALDIILGGKTVAAKHALKLGMVDEVVHKEYLLGYARGLLTKRGNKLMRRSKPLMTRLVNTRLAARLIAKRVQPQLHKKTGGHYPALPKALEVVTEGLGRSIPGS